MINVSINKKKIIRNFVSLYINNGITYLVPLIIVPYVIRMIGISEYGYYIFTFALATYFKILIEFGFDITVSKQIIPAKNDKIIRSKIFTTVLLFRLVLFFISILLFLVILYFIPSSKLYSFKFSIIIFCYVISSVLGINYFYYSFQNIAYSTAVNTICRFLYLISVLLFVKTKNDLPLFGLFTTLNWVLPSAVLLVAGIKKYELSIILPSISSARLILKEATTAFFSDIAVSLYSTTNTMFLGFFSTPYFVGIYGGVEKLYNALITLISSSNFVFYPKLIEAYNNGEEVFRKRIMLLEKLFWCIGLIVCMLVFLERNTITNLFFGKTILLATNYLLIFSLALIFAPFGALYTRVLIIQNQTRKVLKITSIGFLVNLVVLLTIVFIKKYELLPLCVLTTQIYIFSFKKAAIQKHLKLTLPIYNGNVLTCK